MREVPERRKHLAKIEVEGCESMAWGEDAHGETGCWRLEVGPVRILFDCGADAGDRERGINHSATLASGLDFRHVRLRVISIEPKKGLIERGRRRYLRTGVVRHSAGGSGRGRGSQVA